MRLGLVVVVDSRKSVLEKNGKNALHCVAGVGVLSSARIVCLTTALAVPIIIIIIIIIRRKRKENIVSAEVSLACRDKWRRVQKLCVASRPRIERTTPTSQCAVFFTFQRKISVQFSRCSAVL